MCRFAAYLGYEMILENILVHPVNSLIKQSLQARESRIPTNGDGFGVGWYVPEISPNPGLFTSILPAWNDRNLLHLSAKIKSPTFFAHVRAASAGGVNTFNCHPFVHKHWMLMHNGDIHNFSAVKRHLRHLLDDNIYHWIQGETDSEHLFALFLQLSKGKNLSRLSTVASILEKTFHEIVSLIETFTRHGTSYFNVCLTDGHRLVASRYSTSNAIEPESLHYGIGTAYTRGPDKRYHLTKGAKPKCIIVSSERLTDFADEWHDVPPNHMLLVEKDLSISLRPIK